MREEAGDVLGRYRAMSRDELLRLQFLKLKRQLARQYAGNAFFRRRFDAAGVDLSRIRSLADVRSAIPTMDKPDCLADQSAAPPFGERVGVPAREVVMVNLTGGTSGQGQEVYGRTNRDVALQGHLHYLPWHLAGLRPGDLALNCVPAGGLTTGGWGPGEGFRVAGATAFAVGGTLSTDAKIDLMLRFPDIAFIYASTSYLHTLSEGLRRRGIDPRRAFPAMRTLFMAAEGYPVEWAERIQAFWGAALHEGYGSTQGAGFIGGTCEDGAVVDGRRGVMRIFDWHNLVEVLDPATGEPVRAGEEGEVVLTNLDIVASPVIRFRTGDKVRLAEPDGRPGGLAWTGIEAGTIGRIDDMMKIRGNNVWPAAVDGVLFRCEQVADYAGRVYLAEDSRTIVELRLALKAEGAPLSTDERERLIERLRGELKANTNVSMDLYVVARSDLPNYDYKSRRWRDERADGYRTGALRT